jgi:hypothetical protein
MATEQARPVVIADKESRMASGVKRDRQGNARSRDQQPKANIPRTAYTPMFEHFRSELDEHHDRRERIIKSSRDVTALSKKM